MFWDIIYYISVMYFDNMVHCRLGGVAHEVFIKTEKFKQSVDVAASGCYYST